MRFRNVNILTLVIFIVTLVLYTSSAATVFTGKKDERHANNKYSLKNSSFFRNKLSFSSNTSGLLSFKATQIESLQINASAFVCSNVQLQKGNLIVILPLKLKVKSPKYKAPNPLP